jgi:hypothetical protein
MYEDEDSYPESQSHAESVQVSIENVRTLAKQILILTSRIESDIDILHSVRTSARSKLQKLSVNDAKTAKNNLWPQSDDENAVLRLYGDHRKLKKILAQIDELGTESIKSLESFERHWSNRYPLSDKEFGF